jgi:hypothetical protein
MLLAMPVTRRVRGMPHRAHQPGSESTDQERPEAESGWAAMDPGLQDQFDRGDIIVRRAPTSVPQADALQRPHYEPEQSH